MSQGPFSEVVPEYQISYERETYESKIYDDWLRFGDEVFKKGNEKQNIPDVKNKDIIEWDIFKKRMVVLNESEISDRNVDELDIVNKDRIQYAKVCLDWNNLGSEQYLYVSRACIMSYINPRTYLRALKNGAEPDREYSFLANSLAHSLYTMDTMRLVFCQDNAFVTWK